jgi:DNA-3-methyladenine glycosylase I
MKHRCSWCGSDPLYRAYHDKEWGVPVHEDQKLFEMLILEGAQAGLSWLTILKKRENYQQAFNQFDIDKIARYSSDDVQRLMQNAGIVRNRLKIEAVIKNARGAIAIQDRFGSLATYFWDYVDHQARQNSWKRTEEIPSSTEESEKMGKDLKKRGFNFVGSTICYAFMQATGMVNDHITECFRYQDILTFNRSKD